MDSLKASLEVETFVGGTPFSQISGGLLGIMHKSTDIGN